VSDTPLTGLLLAGGAGRRMGRDKAHAVVGGVTLVDRALTVLWSVCEDVLVAPGERPLGRGVEEVADARPGAGPLGGLVAGLERARTPLVAVLAVDLPLASGPVLRALAAAWDGEDAVMPVVDGRREPLHAVWASAAAPALRVALERGDLALHRAAAGLRVRSAGREVWGDAAGRSAFWHNVNTPRDLAAVPALAAGPPERGRSDGTGPPPVALPPERGP